MNPELRQAIEQAVWYPYNVVEQQPGESTHSWIVRAVMATLEPTLAGYQRLLAYVESEPTRHTDPGEGPCPRCAELQARLP